MISLTKDKRMLGYEALAPYPDISCFVTTRHGGCSTGNYASFNCTPYTGDHPDCVRKNQELLCAALPFTPRELVIPFQTHGISSLIIDETYLNATHSERQSMLQGVDAHPAVASASLPPTASPYCSMTRNTMPLPPSTQAGGERFATFLRILSAGCRQPAVRKGKTS